MDVEEKLNLNKNLYKTNLWFAKITPYVLYVGCFLNTILSYIGIKTEILSMMTGVSLIPYILIVLFSFTFKLCKYHRMMIYYVGITECIAWTDHFFGHSVSDNVYFTVLFLIAGVFFVLTAYYKIKNK